VGRILLIDAAASALVLAIWYGFFVRYNRRRGDAALRWAQIACRGRGKVTEAVWLGSSRVRARIQFPSQWFGNAHLTVSLLPRPLPMRWLLSHFRKEKETLTFDADLDCAPSFGLDVLNHRWCGRSSSAALEEAEWQITRPGPIVLTTHAEWTQELSPVVNALIHSREHNLLQVRFRPTSPNFSATLDLDSLTDPNAATGFLNVLRELANGAKAKQV
jgi:hypothetical protein